MRAFPRLIIWFLILSFSGQYHSYISIKVLVNFSYPARAMISVQIYLRQSSIRDPPDSVPPRQADVGPSSFPSSTIPTLPSEGLLSTANRRPARLDRLPQLARSSAGHRYPSSGRRPPDHVTEKLGIEAGLKLPPPLFSHSLG